MAFIKSTMLEIGKIKIDNPVFLAPMAGVTDTVFRTLCKKMGAGVVYTEFVSSNGIIRENKKTLDMMEFSDFERPIGIQIFGDSAQVLGDSAKLIKEKFSPDIIDINFGCPVPKITTKGAGSGAMKDIGLMIKMAESVVKNSGNTPVTVKMRAGWSDRQIISTQAGKELEDVGIKAITLHPRTSKQRFTGKADWRLIADLKEKTNIPIIGNGDIKTPEDVVLIKNKTHCDGVMIGRASLGNPWIFKQINSLLKEKQYTEITLKEKIDLCNEHYALLKKEKNENLCLNLTKKHYSWYLKGFPNASYWRTGFMKCKTINEFDAVLVEMNKSIVL